MNDENEKYIQKKKQTNEGMSIINYITIIVLIDQLYRKNYLLYYIVYIEI